MTKRSQSFGFHRYVLFIHDFSYLSVIICIGGKTFYRLKISGNSMFSKYNESNIDIFELYTSSKYIKEQIATLPVRIIGIAREKRTRL